LEIVKSKVNYQPCRLKWGMANKRSGVAKFHLDLNEHPIAIRVYLGRDKARPLSVKYVLKEKGADSGESTTATTRTSGPVIFRPEP